MALASCCGKPQQQKPKNVIYLIGDGMGFGAVSSLLLSEEEKTGFEMTPVIGLNETQSANNYVTDSPAGGTAHATDSLEWTQIHCSLQVYLKRLRQWAKRPVL